MWGVRKQELSMQLQEWICEMKKTVGEAVLGVKSGIQ